MNLRPVDKRAQDLSVGVGWVGLGMGLLLMLAPGTGAALLGWGGRTTLARVIGALDLIVGPGLLLDRARRVRSSRPEPS